MSRSAYIFFLLIFTSITFHLDAVGQSTKEIQIKLLEKVNHLRDSLQLDPLKLDITLNECASDHCFYISKKGKLTHFQKTFRKETPLERLIYFGGNRTYVGENVATIPPSKTSDLNEYIAEAFYQSWYHSPKHYLNMIHPYMTQMGFAMTKGGNNNYYGVQVFSSNEIKLPASFKNPDFSWGVRPIEFTCKDEPQVYETMFFANYVIQEGDSIFFYFHDLEFFNKVIQGDNDGLAIDIVLREQLPCHKENQFHSSEIHDGEMQEPIYKYELLKNNSSQNPKKIKTKIGVVPKYLSNKQWAANVIIINDNKLCDYSIPTEVPSAVIPLLPLKIYYEVDSSVLDTSALASFKLQKDFHVELIYEKNAQQYEIENQESLSNLISWSDYLKLINIECYASVEGKKWMNEKLLEKRHNAAENLIKSYFGNAVNYRIDTSENWFMMNAQIQDLDLSELKEKNHSEVKLVLKQHPSSLYDSLLFEQRKTHLYASIDTTIKVRSTKDLTFAKHFDSTISLFTMPWNTILVEDHILNKRLLPKTIVDSLIPRKEVRTNLLGAITHSKSVSFVDSIGIIDLSKLNDTNQILKFNYANFMTHYWFNFYLRGYQTKGIANPTTPDKLLQLAESIDTNIIAINDIQILKINILLSGIHYYVAYNEWEKKEEYFSKISDLLAITSLTPEEATDLALFSNHFHKFKLAVDILAPYHDNHLLHEDGKFVLAKTATLIQNILEKEAYLGYMLSAKEANLGRYCSWLNHQFQIQRVEELKLDYCDSCH